MAKKLGIDKIPGFFTFYTARKNGEVQGYAHFDTHKVRTKEETICIVMDSGGKVKVAELVSFYEPEDYAPPERWLKLFTGKSADELSGINAMTGATLTAREVTSAVKRAILVFQSTLKKQGFMPALKPDWHK